MPTKRKRHMITETDEVAAALERVRHAHPGHPVNLSELVVLGAQRKIELVEREHDDGLRRAELRERFLRRTRSGVGIDWDAGLDVHARGWAHAADG